MNLNLKEHVECDVRNSESVRIAVNATTEQFGRLDGIVTNAGFGISGRVLETPINDWMSQYKMKLASVLNVVNAAVPALRKSNAGCTRRLACKIVIIGLCFEMEALFMVPCIPVSM